MTDKLDQHEDDAQSMNSAWLAPREPLHIGSLCPKCGKGKLDYNGLYELECQACGFIDKSNSDCGCSFQADAV
jgi:uncharacterized protein (DUF983 family)